MCRMASFLWKDTEAEGLQIAVWRLDSHSDTQEYLKLSEKMGWYEGHYLPSGSIECRTPDGCDAEICQKVKDKYTSFNIFLLWCFDQPLNFGGYLDLSGCDLKGIKLPQSVGGSLYLSGCDLKGIKLPQSVGGYLYLRGCDLKGIKLPEEYLAKVIK